jgi:hypothetical protein
MSSRIAFDAAAVQQQRFRDFVPYEVLLVSAARVPNGGSM